MANRRFEDPQGEGWEIVPESDRRWRLEPLEENDQLARMVSPPAGVDDPFELSEKELHEMFAGGRPSGETEVPEAGEES